MNINTATISGNLTADPNVREHNDKKFASFTVAINGTNDHTDFVRCNAFGKTAEFIEQYAKKGAKVALTGRLHTSNFEKQGVKVSTVEVDVQNFELVGNKASAQVEDTAGDEPAELPFS